MSHRPSSPDFYALLLLSLFFPDSVGNGNLFPQAISSDDIAQSSRWRGIGLMDRRMATSIYQPDIHIRLCPSSPRSNGSRRNFFHECALRAPYDAPRERIFLVYSPYVTLWPRKRERETDLNTLIPLISRVGSFKVSNGERFRLIKRRRLGSPDFAENLRSVASPLSIIRSISLDIYRGSNVS